MPRFFVESVPGDRIIITGEDARHIGRSLRMKKGESLTVCCDGKDYECRIADFTDSEVFCDVLSISDNASEPATRLTLFQAMPKSDKAELIVQKAVELGVYEIVLTDTARCISKPDKKSFAKRLERLNKVALSAAKQSGRGIVPKVSGIITYDEMLGRFADFDKVIMCYEKGGAPLGSAGLEKGKDIALIIGSEGGFEQQEADKASQSGAYITSLGSRILRCETAPLAAISIIMNICGEM